MLLETHEGIVADPATPDDVARVVAGLTQRGDAYVIMSATVDDESYVQAAGTVGEDFIVERRDGCSYDHYRGDRRITAGELEVMLTGYLHGTADWSHAISWHRVRVDDFGAGTASA